MKLRFIINLSCLLFVSTSSIELKAVDDHIPKELSPLLKEPIKIAGNNSKELLRAVSQLSDEKADALIFLIKNMPERDLKNLTADYLVENVNYAFKARKDSEWASKVPKDIFLNDVLPYASINERRDRWRKDFYSRFSPLVKKCKSLEEAAQILNKEMWKMINVRYHARKRPNLIRVLMSPLMPVLHLVPDYQFYLLMLVDL